MSCTPAKAPAGPSCSPRDPPLDAEASASLPAQRLVHLRPAARLLPGPVRQGPVRPRPLSRKLTLERPRLGGAVSPLPDLSLPAPGRCRP